MRAYVPCHSSYRCLLGRLKCDGGPIQIEWVAPSALTVVCYNGGYVARCLPRGTVVQLRADHRDFTWHKSFSSSRGIDNVDFDAEAAFPALLMPRLIAKLVSELSRDVKSLAVGRYAPSVLSDAECRYFSE